MAENKDNIKKEKTTKERICEAAIDLFAQNGFDATPMREIAEAVGIKQSSLYTHFKSKNEILEKIIEYLIMKMYNAKSQNIKEEGIENVLLSMEIEDFMISDGDYNISLMEKPYTEKIWRIIFVELYHNKQIKKFFSEFSDKLYSGWEQMFTFMIKHKRIKPLNPKSLAKEHLLFYRGVYMEYFLLKYDTSNSFKQEYEDLIKEHAKFMANSMKLE